MKLKDEQLKELLLKLAKLRGGEIMVYVTGDKAPIQRFGAAIALDVLPLFYQHLSKLGKQKKISLFLYSCGGQLDAPWPIVNLIREYCNEFEVIVPFKSLSAATLISLGADKIVMTPLSQLSPIDPTGTFQVSENKTENISIEDVMGFLNFAKEKIGIAEQNALAELLKRLTEQIKPSILGSVNRTHSLVRELAKKMLKLHSKKLEEEQIQKLVDNLVEKLFSHNHLINRKEAQNTIGLKEIVQYSTEKEEKLINKVFNYYQDKLELNKDFDPVQILKKDIEKEYTLIRAIIFSFKKENRYISKYKITKTPSPVGKNSINVNSFYNKWE